MTRRVPIADVIMLLVPPIKMDLPVNELENQLLPIAVTVSARQYTGPDTPRLEGFRVEWLITSDPAQVQTFQPAHDCQTCQAGNAKGIAYLAEHPEAMLALGNIFYDEVWP